MNYLSPISTVTHYLKKCIYDCSGLYKPIKFVNKTDHSLNEFVVQPCSNRSRFFVLQKLFSMLKILLQKPVFSLDLQIYVFIW